ncbi:MAG: hypothetical protein AB7O24_14430 [Kofleriaceae bacterium]
MTTASALALSGCGAANDPSTSEGETGAVEVALVPAQLNRNLDLLFVVDDSPGMLEKQGALRFALPTLLEQLELVPGGLPNLHVGVVSSDLGTQAALDATPGPPLGRLGQGGCASQGKGGILQTYGAALLGGGNYITDILRTDASRIANYSGSLADALGRMTAAGEGGCNFEQHLEAIKVALDDNPSNGGFVRPDAMLGVIVLADEDDCSMAHSTLISEDSSKLGAIASFRCTRHGVVCDDDGADPDAMNETGLKSKCRASTDSPYVADIDRYVTFLEQLKGSTRPVMMSVIAGQPDPFHVELRPPPQGGVPQPALSASCTYAGVQGLTGADPAVRLFEFASRFHHGVTASVCGSDYRGALTKIAVQIETLLVGDPCLDREITLPAACEATELRDSDPGFSSELPSCSDAVTTDCFRLISDPGRCSGGQNLRLQVVRSGPPPTDGWTSLRCDL